MVKMEVKRRCCGVSALQGYGGEVGLLHRQDVERDLEGGSLNLRRDQWEMFQVAIRSEPAGSQPGGMPGVLGLGLEVMGLVRPQR